MAFNPKFSLEGIQEVMARNLRRVATMKVGGAAEQAVKDMGFSLHRHAVAITHVGKYAGGGALKSSHRIKLDGLEGIIYIDPSSVSPRRGRTTHRPSIYGVYENERGGEHAFYDRTEAEAGPAAISQARTTIIEAVINGE